MHSYNPPNTFFIALDKNLLPIRSWLLKSPPAKYKYLLFIRVRVKLLIMLYIDIFNKTSIQYKLGINTVA